jgi:LacI family transcriptional regulator
MARTLDDVASLSGVSRATVSRVINGGPVAEPTRLRVLAVLESTGFRPNRAARTLASGRSGVVGVVLHMDPHLLFGDRYFSQLLQGISDGLAERSTGMMLWLGHRSKEETLDRILSMSLDGVIVTAHGINDPLVDGLLESRLPTILVGHRSADRNASYVDIDNVAAAGIVTSHLVRVGRTRIGHVTGARGTFSAEDRVTGYQAALRRAGLPPDGLIVDGDYTEPAGAAGAAALLDRGVDAIFCANDLAARGALRVLHERGVAVPGEVAQAGSTT